ncbi:MAG: 6-carboxytetrahydropterin synthase [Bacteroidota bacterium]
MDIHSRKVSVSRREHFNAAHRLHVPAWSDEKNRQVFGLCNNPSYHGHNYELIVKLSGFADAETGYLVDLKLLSNLIKEQVLNRFDHRNLNLDVAEFKNLNPTAENIAAVIYNLLRPHLNAALQMKITLYETDRNFVEYPED